MKRLLVSIGFFLIASVSFSQSYKQYTIFLYSFARYIQWPDDYNTGDFEITVLGDCPIMDELVSMAQAKKTGERNIKVTKLNSTDEIKKCNILFIPAEKSNLLEGILAKVNTQSILVVTEDPGSGAKGSCVNFIMKEGKLAFELNKTALTKHNLKVSNELARLAIMI